MKESAEKPLSDKQQFLIEQYFNCKCNKTEAYIAAGYKAKNYNVAQVSAHTLFQKPKIQAAIEKRKKELLEEIKADQLKTVQQVQNCVFADVRKLFDENGQMFAIPDIDDATAAAISTIKIVKRKNPDTYEMEDVVEVKLVDKKGSTEQLLKIQGLLNDKLELLGSGSIDINVNIDDGE